jgi:hypothetical protein
MTGFLNESQRGPELKKTARMATALSFVVLAVAAMLVGGVCLVLFAEAFWLKSVGGTLVLNGLALGGLFLLALTDSPK